MPSAEHWYCDTYQVREFLLQYFGALAYRYREDVE
jgi:hypothetical protein